MCNRILFVINRGKSKVYSIFKIQGLWLPKVKCRVIVFAPIYRSHFSVEIWWDFLCKLNLHDLFRIYPLRFPRFYSTANISISPNMRYAEFLFHIRCEAKKKSEMFANYFLNRQNGCTCFWLANSLLLIICSSEKRYCFCSHKVWHVCSFSWVLFAKWPVHCLRNEILIIFLALVAKPFGHLRILHINRK